MGRRRPAQRVEVVAALQRGDKTPAALIGSQPHQLPRGPGEILLLQAQRGQRIVLMGIEAGRNDHQVRAELGQGRQHMLGKGMAERLAIGQRRQRYVQDIVEPALVGRPGAGIERRLMGRGVEHVMVVPEDILRAIAVMHVEIDHDDALQPVHGAGVIGPDSRAVEQAEPHGAHRFGMVPGRAHGAEGVLRLAANDRIHGGANRPRRAQRRLQRVRRDQRVRVDPAQPLGRNRGLHRIDMRLRMGAQQLRLRSLRRHPPFESGEARRVQRLQHGAQPVRPFRVIGAGIMSEASLVRVQQRRHWFVPEETRKNSGHKPKIEGSTPGRRPTT